MFVPVFDLTLALDLQACGIVPDEPLEFGACDFEFEYNVAEPFDDIRGDVARVYLYFQAAYGMELTDEEESQFEAWHEADPSDEWERMRDERAFDVRGSRNPYFGGGRVKG